MESSEENSEEYFTPPEYSYIELLEMELLEQIKKYKKKYYKYKRKYLNSYL
jgi:hypothetical protein